MFQFVHEVHTNRQNVISQRCSRFRGNYTTQSFLAKLNYNIGFYDPFRFLYCRIQKVGSTFLRRTMKKLFGGVDYQAFQGGRMILNRSKDFIDCLPKTSKFMFVREPYGRALSGYVDKLFAPNPVYWKSIGRHVVHEIRGLNASDLSRKCGHDVTFPEFLKYLVVSQKKSEHRDRHFYPMYEHCFPCDIKYDFIGKLETFQDDVSTLLNSFNSTFSVEMSFNDFELESDLTTAKNHVGLLYHFKKRTTECEPFHRSLLRLWRDLQIRGVLPIDVQMPFSPQQAKTVLQSEVVSEINKTIHTTQNRKLLKKQRQEAKIEAFSLISKTMLKEYRHLFRLDFELFDYPSNPPFIVHRNASSTKQLKYFNILDSTLILD
ncbi:carbohydrate sulfotransferase 8-like [Ostrea edulis]|uniref:carbohydrate sulfotransferase 8-like n=1 Tax=Ostrea edulis TaxID=37623 RepID=UPI0024AFC36E|nr:carbohydrate sulfotransferase 8-like [Ostrea edulis]